MAHACKWGSCHMLASGVHATCLQVRFMAHAFKWGIWHFLSSGLRVLAEPCVYLSDRCHCNSLTIRDVLRKTFTVC
eukprot:1157161-Pelagomonas_calceolata.AAC.11